VSVNAIDRAKAPAQARKRSLCPRLVRGQLVGRDGPGRSCLGLRLGEMAGIYGGLLDGLVAQRTVICEGDLPLLRLIIRPA